ncbi:DUF5103 domain-containing protein [Christiangramia fulva]|uniref:DUF5103 domain-containing protein n=1 Tax=Christiangramia fulva TaxID=2126553 RepID=A0A2R3Z5Q1_9FLAO|nr:DUF5103 domain-containing protein [Christiangramia fulva]AVR45542.1 DUF5103 domain-containing protein [Christiangramia fulva]
MKISLFFLLFICSSLTAFSQTGIEKAPPNFIRTIKFEGGNNEFSGNPILPLGAIFQLSFDDIIGDEADYYYSIEHFNFDWTPSDLSKNEFMEGFDDVRITQYTNAYNTLQPYTHYELKIPNSNTKGLKVSGNYMLSVFNSNRELVFSRKFMVYEPIVKVQAEVKRSRDLRFINEKQVINFSVNSPDLVLINPEKNVKTLVMQNNNLKSAIKDLKPQYIIGSELIYKYDQESAFWGGNEYFQFNDKDLRATTADIASVDLLELYHHYLYPDYTRNDIPYTYNPDINGGFVIRNLQGKNSEIEAEYVWVHFSLKNNDIIGNSQIHIYGGFNNFEIDNSTLLHYNEETGLYETARLFKQGYYNYKYVLVDPDGTIDDGFICGNFDETENLYSILVYYRSPGARYDRLIGVGSADSRIITN